MKCLKPLTVLASALTIVLACGVVHADYPLNLKYVIDVPAGITSFDAQYWMSDSVIGYAYTRTARGDTLYWKTSVTDTLLQLHLPLCEDWGQLCRRRVACLLRLEQYPNDPIVSTLDEVEAAGWSSEYLPIRNLYAGTLIRDISLGIGGSENPPFCYFSWPFITVPWPPPPQASHTIAVSAGLSTISDGAGVDTYRDFPASCFVDLNDSIDFHAEFPRRGALSAFRRFGAETMFAAKQYYSELIITNYGSSWHAYWWVSTMISGHDSMRTDTFFFPMSTPVAQTDANGINRVITYQPFVAYDPVTWDTLWQRPVMQADSVLAVRLPDSDDERLLLLRNSLRRFAVLSADDGSDLQSTATYLGNFHHVIKRRYHPDEIVTLYDPPGPGGWQILVYEFGMPGVEGLTIRYIPNTNVVRLRWQAREGADSYCIKSSTAMDGESQTLATVAAPQLSYDVSLTDDSLRFFHVTAPYDSMR